MLARTRTDVEAKDLTFLQVVQYPKAYLDKFVTHHLSNLPDRSDKPVIDYTTLQLWTKDAVGATKRAKNGAKREQQAMPHKWLKGMHGRRVNRSFDWSMSKGGWPVIFKDKGACVRKGLLLDYLLYALVATSCTHLLQRW